MLKVNKKKISIEEFAKKYGIEKNHFGLYVSIKKGIQVSIPNGIIRAYFLADEDGSNDIDFDALFDMISSGDIIKEESK